MTFKERFQAGDCTMNLLEDLSELWHRYFNDKPLNEFLGLDDVDTYVWTIHGTDSLAQRLSQYAYPRYTGIRVYWVDLRLQLDAMLLDILGHKYSARFELEDNCNWKIVFQFQGEMDEKHSRYIIQRLGLREVNLNDFTTSPSISLNQAKGLWSKMFHRDVSHVFADQGDIWFLHKAYQVPEERRASNLIIKWEKQLRRQINSQRYPAMNHETAAHQLYGFVKALEVLGFAEKDKYLVQLDHFSKDPSLRISWPAEDEPMP